MKINLLSVVGAVAIAGIVGCTDQPTSNDVSPVLKATRVAQGVTIEPIGEPIWEPTDFHLASVEMGYLADWFPTFFENIQAILPPPNHAWVDALGVGPGQAHAAPYDVEIGAGVKALGLRESVQFKEKEFSDGWGVMLTWMNVPAPGVIGSSPDFTSGPIIPNTIFPIQVSGPALRNKQPFDPWLAAGTIPALDAAVEARFTGLDGHSHFPMFCVTNAELGTAGNLQGSYIYDITMLDATGNGWKINAHFAIGN